MTSHEPDAVDVLRFVHRVQHLEAAKGLGRYTPTALVLQCWNHPIGELPEWAQDAAAANHPATEWCPILNPGLSAM
jgi:hypothetical protein